MKLITKYLYSERLVSWTYSYCVCKLSFLVSNSTQTILNCRVEMARRWGPYLTIKTTEACYEIHLRSHSWTVCLALQQRRNRLL
jgi:hypothetical protein